MNLDIDMSIMTFQSGLFSSEWNIPGKRDCRVLSPLRVYMHVVVLCGKVTSFGHLLGYINPHMTGCLERRDHTCR